MAIDQSRLLQMLLQGGGGGISISPTSGLRDPSLSGLALGPQGMGLGGGESLIGGGAAGFGGEGGGGLGGLDLSQLLAQLQAAPGITGASLTAGLGAGGLGGFGAGGQIGQDLTGSLPTASQQGQAGLGSAGTAAQFLSLLKEGTGLGKTLTQLFPKGTQTSPMSDLNSVLAEMGISGTPFIPTASAVSGEAGGSLPSLPLDSAQTIPFQINPDMLSGASGGGFFGGVGGIGGVGEPVAISAPFLAGGGPESVGQVAKALAPETSFLSGLGGISDVLGGAGVLSNIGLGALNLSQGNLGPGIGSLSGTALGAAIGSVIPGIGTLLGAALGGGAGGLFGGLFGGGRVEPPFSARLAETLPRVLQAGQELIPNISNARSKEDLAAIIQSGRQNIENLGVGGFTGPNAQLQNQIGILQNIMQMKTGGRRQFAIGPYAPEGIKSLQSQLESPFFFPGLPGATGTTHEGGLKFNPAHLDTAIQQAISAALARFG